MLPTKTIQRTEALVKAEVYEYERQRRERQAKEAQRQKEQMPTEGAKAVPDDTQ